MTITDVRIMHTFQQVACLYLYLHSATKHMITYIHTCANSCVNTMYQYVPAATSPISTHTSALVARLCRCTCLHEHTYPLARMHTCTHIHLHTCTHAHISTCTHAHMHTCTHARMHTRLLLCTPSTGCWSVTSEW